MYKINTVLFGAIEHTRKEQQEQEAQKEIEEKELYRSTLKKKFARKKRELAIPVALPGKPKSVYRCTGTGIKLSIY